jgi:hypothetical protein
MAIPHKTVIRKSEEEIPIGRRGRTWQDDIKTNSG